MKTASHIFYLAVISFLGEAYCANYNSASKIQILGPELCAISPNAVATNACSSYLALEKLNIQLRNLLTNITHNTDFFSYYRLNLFGKECPYWSDNDGVCGNIACAVNTLDNESQIPLIWRAEELGKLEGPSAVRSSTKVKGKHILKQPPGSAFVASTPERCSVKYENELDERDYCVPEDESIGSRGDYVSLIDNPERFTGYAGEGARQIWDAIYRENCFSRLSFPKSSPLSISKFSPRPAANELHSIIQQHGRQQAFEDQQKHLLQHTVSSGSGIEDECLEKRVFYRIVSGMHTSISAHICAEYLNQTTGTWSPNLECYKARLHSYPDRVANLYFNFALVLRAVTKLGPYLSEYTFCSGDLAQDSLTRSKVQSLVSAVTHAPQDFDESLMFVNGEGPSLKEDFRQRFRNISRIMDCVGCDKCRLWGKLQTQGYGTALKVLFELDNKTDNWPRLRRTEIVALFNTLDRISASLEAIMKFRKMIEGVAETSPKKADINKVIPDRAKKPHHVIPEVESSKEENHQGEDGTFHRRRLTSEATLLDQLNAELDLFWRVLKFVVRSWIEFPGKLWQILKFEVPRAWDSYIGLPVKPRRWALKKPNLNEL
ncbi:Endoplasmic reticulum oxidoreductin-1 [Podosphaera aphanis]|nr:Endoplasmic reticulum oxidoreductin-1 [Podosphaera aphanis]